jgi:transcriptional regulator with XRE-family HTH domain
MENSLRHYREAAGVSIRNLARLTPCSPGTIVRAEHGRQDPYDETWRRLALALDVPVEALRVPPEIEVSITVKPEEVMDFHAFVKLYRHDPATVMALVKN